MDNSRRFLELSKKKRKMNFISLLLSVLIMFTIVMWFIKSNNNAPPRKRYHGGTYNVGHSEDYENVIGMTPLKADIVDSKQFELSLDTLIDSKLVYTEYNDAGKRLPVMGYVSPAGRVVMAVSYCEPCRSETFRIDGRSKDKHLVCETCGTVWRLNDLKGLYGGCVYYPPEEIPYTVEGNRVAIEVQILDEWKPREYSDSIEM